LGISVFVVNNKINELDLGNRTEKILLATFAALSLLSAFGMRFCFWGDEVATYHMVNSSWSEFWCSFAEWEPHPPLYFALLKLWSGIFGSSEIALRLPSVLLFPAIVFLTWLIAKKLGLSQRARLVAAGLLALHPSMWIYVRMARYYSITVLLFLVNTIILLNAAKKGRWRWWLYAASLTLLLWTDFPAYLVIPMHLAVILWQNRPSFKGWLLGVAVALVLAAVPLLLFARAGFSYAEDSMPSVVSVAIGFFYSIYSFLVGEVRYPWQLPTALALVAVVFLIIRGIVRRPKTSLILCAGPIFVGLLLLCLLFQKLPFIYYSGRFSFLFPMVALVLGVGTEKLRMPIFIAAMVILGTGYLWGIAGVVSGKDYHNTSYVVPWKGIASDAADSGATIAVSRDWAAVHYLNQKMDAYLPDDFREVKAPKERIAFVKRSGIRGISDIERKMYVELEGAHGEPIAHLQYVRENRILLKLKKTILKCNFPEYVVVVYIFE